MRSYEAKNVEEAIKKACTDLGVDASELTYFVKEEKEGGLFGIGARARIEAYVQSDIVDFVKNYISKFFENIGMNCDIEGGFTEEGLMIELNADNNAVLIGKAGQTLQAITTVVKSAASAEFKRHVNLIIDVNGYKKDRYEKLKNMVGKIARTVVKTKVSARLGQMSNDERKVVHQYLSTFQHIRTESEGEGANRRLKIIYDETR